VFVAGKVCECTRCGRLCRYDHRRGHAKRVCNWWPLSRPSSDVRSAVRELPSRSRGRHHRDPTGRAVADRSPTSSAFPSKPSIRSSGPHG